MKILHVIPSINAGGAERQCVELLKELAVINEINLVLVIFENKIEYSEILDLNIKIIVIDRKNYNGIELVRKLREIIKREKPDIMHTWLSFATITGILAGLFIKIKTVNGMIRYGKKINRFSLYGIISKLTLILSHRVVSNSKAGLISHHLKENNKNRVIYNGIDLTRFNENKNKQDLRSELGLVSTDFIIGMVANITSAKDYSTFVLAAREISKKQLSIYFVSIGKGDPETLNKYVELSDISNLRFLGFRDDVTDCIKSFDVGVLLSNTHGHAEGLSNSIMEYMIEGKPVIATSDGGNPELIKNGYNGYLIAPFAIDEFIEKIIFLYNNRDIGNQFGNLSKKLICNNFSNTRMSQQYIDIYKDLI